MTLLEAHKKSINSWQSFIIEWRMHAGFETNWDNLAEKVMLIITELGRAVDAHRKDQRELVEHELIDGLIRYLDLLGSLHLDTDSLLDKAMKNNYRRIHKHGKNY